MLKAFANEAEDRLISRAQSGDLQAFNEIVLAYRTGAINVVYRLCGNASIAEDAAQIAFIKAWQNLRSYRPHSSFRNWLYRIAVNTALDMLRREKRLVGLDDLPEISGGDDPRTVFEGRERQEQVRKAVLALPPASRAVLVLREYEGFSYREIADTLDIPIGSVMSRLSYARRHLLGNLSPYLEEV